jgi:DNA primase catalytic core
MTADRGQPGAGEDGTLAGDERATIARVNQIANQFFRDELRSSWVPGYLVARGFSTAVQAHWHTGYAPANWSALICHLHSRGYTDRLIEHAGLGRRSAQGSLIDTFRDRAMFPVRSADGTVAGFIGRAPWDAPPGVPKYLNSPRTSLYDKSTLLFGLCEARGHLAAGLRPVIVEGPLDAIAITTAGQGHFVGLAPCGTALTAQHVTTLTQAADLRATGVAVAFDPDPAGRRAAARAYYLLTPFTDNLVAVDLQPGTDPAHILAKQGRTALAELVSRSTQPLADVVIDGEVAKWDPWLGHAEGQINAMHAAAPLIAAMPPTHVGRQVARLADRLGLSYGLVTGAVIDELSGVSTARPTWAPPTAHPALHTR